MRIRLIFFTFILLCSHQPLKSQLVAWGDTTICQGGSAQLYADGGGVSYYWMSYPTDPSLLIPQQQNPNVSPVQTTMYVVQSNIATGNLILSGSFELGNIGFSSEYVYSPTSIYEEGTYAVVNDAHTVHPSFFCNQDHTSGAGKFMAVNGAGVPGVQVWYLNLSNVQPNTEYEFSTWITSLHSTNPALLQFSINGVLMGQPFQAYSTTCVWYQFFHVWNSGNNTSANISIVNQNTILSGNDFALDDISFATVLVYYDTVWVTVLPQFESPFSTPGLGCIEDALTIEYTGDSPPDAIYHWDFADGEVISGSGQGPYQVSYSTVGPRTISLWVEGDGCTSDTTEHDVIIYGLPQAEVTADDLIVPYLGVTVLHGEYSGDPGPLVFAWSPEELLEDPASADPQTLSLDQTTTFLFTVTDQVSGCQATDEITITVAGGPLSAFADAEPETICPGGQSVLTAYGSGGSGSYTYWWSSEPAGFNSDLPEVTVEPEVSTIYTVEVEDGLSSASASVTVAIHPLPLANAGPDQDIPYGTSTSLEGTATGGSGSYDYHWAPEGTVLDPNNAITATVNLVQTTLFTLVVTDGITGCIALEDQVLVTVTGGPLALSIGSSAGSICVGDTAVLTAYASGGNEGYYTYSWTDNLGNTFPDEPTITVSPESTTIFHLVVDDGFNSTDAFFTLAVHPNPEFAWEGEADTILACPYDTVSLVPDPRPEDWQYLWSNGSTADHLEIGTTGIGFDVREIILETSNEAGCTFERKVTVVFDFSYCFGVDDPGPSSNRLIVSPNPSGGSFLISATGLKPVSNLVVYDLQGREVARLEPGKAGTAPQVRLDMTGSARGVYFLKASIGGDVMTARVVLW